MREINVFNSHMKLSKHYHLPLAQEETFVPTLNPEGLNDLSDVP